MKFYVGNLSPMTTPEEVRKLFERFGVVTRADVYQMGNGAFGRVEMPDAVEGQNSIDGLDGTILHGNRMLVNQCWDRGDPDEPRFDEDEKDEEEETD